jgi:simple sugar transport system ATP-binding protein
LSSASLQECAVELVSISKRYGNVCALDNVTLRVRKGTIHAVVGENGAGKTTLMRALYGAMRPDSGEIFVHGQPIKMSDSAAAIAHGIGMVSQHYSIIPEISNLENLILGSEGGPLLKSSNAARAEKLADSMGFEFNWDAQSSELSPAGAQKLEILKLLWRNCHVMILDEPTAMLSPQDSDMLYLSLKALANSGATVIVITHRLPEVFEHCEHVTILRGGSLVADMPVAKTNPSQLAELIVGGEMEPRETLKPIGSNHVRLRISNLVAIGERGDEATKCVSLEAKAGQLIGIAGVDGNGQRELFQAILGTCPVRTGEITWDSENWNAMDTAGRIRSGLRLIAEDRYREAMVAAWSLIDNAFLGIQRCKKALSTSPKAAAQAIAEKFNTRHGGLHQSIGSLSGGNQQRFVAARAMYDSPQLILAFQPTRGLDINSTTLVYRELQRECAKGAVVLVVSFDLDELLDFCDRIVVMCNGRLSEPAAHEAANRQAIGRLMVGS